MQPEFWHDRWRRNEIGFHQSRAHPGLERYLPVLGLRDDDIVFVPLCGKSLDMIRLRDQGARILGVELSDIAVQAFFNEHRISAQVLDEGPFSVFMGGGFRLLAGDFFQLDLRQLAGIRAVYDRAALIALPPALRVAYADHLTLLVPAGTHMLLITHEYPEHEMTGPPFSVPETEVRALYTDGFAVEVLERRDVLIDHPAFRNRGATALFETAYLLTRHGRRSG